MLPLSNAQALEQICAERRDHRRPGPTPSPWESGFIASIQMQRFVSKDATRKQFSDLENGDHVSLLGDIVGGAYYVDFLQYNIPTILIIEEEDGRLGYRAVRKRAFGIPCSISCRDSN